MHLNSNELSFGLLSLIEVVRPPSRNGLMSCRHCIISHFHTSLFLDYALIWDLLPSNIIWRGPDEDAPGTGLMKSLFSPEIDESYFAWTMQQVTKMNAKNASELLVNHATQDWQDVPATITVPTLVVGGDGSFFNHTGVESIAKQIPGGEVKIFGKNKGGSHFMFWENPKGCNRVVEEFLSPVL